MFSWVMFPQTVLKVVEKHLKSFLEPSANKEGRG